MHKCLVGFTSQAMYYVYLVAPYDDTSMYIVSNNEGIQGIADNMMADLSIFYLIMRVYMVQLTT